jgi:hypothetical protein
MANDQGNIADKVPAASGKLAHGDPVVLRDSKQMHIEVKPFYVPRTGGEELTIKIASQKKAEGTPFRVGTPAEINLKHDEIVTLHEALHRFLAVTDEEDGRYVVIRLDEGERVQARKLAAVLSQPGVAARLTAEDLNAEVAFALAAPVRIRDLEAAVAELRYLLESGDAEEATYQDWCDRHHWAFGNVYVARDDVRTIALGDQVDLLMKSSLNGLRDVYELKRPNMKVLGYDETHKSFYWSRDTTMAIGQCHRYLDALHEGAANGLRDHPEITAYHPRAVIVIGRSVDWSDNKHRALHGLNARLHGIQVQTYDHLLAQAEATLALIRGDEKS